ncbi:hypothetical protein NKL05_13640 [Mesorhizobium sp. C420B]|uniref:hypothetical protein n=1 Tax=Mesorhizobium sp. C420B TaxID=2956835 RepID=UPI00333C528E
MRDLIHEGCAYLDGAAYDPVILGLAAVGLTIAVVTVTILGATTPARVGATVLKAASKGGRLSKPLRGELVRLAGDAVDGEALRATVTLARAGDLAAACATLRGVLRPAPLATLRTAAADLLGIVAKAQGYRATADVLKLWTSAADMGRFTRLSARFGRGSGASSPCSAPRR